MPSIRRTGCNKNNRIGFIAVGFSVKYNFWYSSEGVFNNEDEAIRDLENLYPVDISYAVKLQLRRT